MINLSRWVVKIDLNTEIEEYLQNILFFVNVIKPEKILFIYILKMDIIPIIFNKKDVKPIDEKLVDRNREKIINLFNHLAKIEIKDIEGGEYFEPWRESYVNKSDLLILNKEIDLQKNYKITEKFIKRSFCSVLIIPNLIDKIKNIIVPVEDTPIVLDSLTLACKLKENMIDINIDCLHIYENSGINLIEESERNRYMKHLEKMAKNMVKELLILVDHPQKEQIHKVVINDDNKSIATNIVAYSRNKNIDFVIINSSSKDIVTNFFIGSVTEEFIKINHDIPYLLLKKKINKVSAWEILKNFQP